MEGGSVRSGPRNIADNSYYRRLKRSLENFLFKLYLPKATSFYDTSRQKAHLNDPANVAIFASRFFV